MQITPLQRVERLARQQNAARCEEALARAQAALDKAKQEMRLIACTLAEALNSELDHLPNAQAVARASVLPDEVTQRIAVMEEELSEMAFLAINELRKEAGDEA